VLEAAKHDEPLACEFRRKIPLMNHLWQSTLFVLVAAIAAAALPAFTRAAAVIADATTAAGLRRRSRRMDLFAPEHFDEWRRGKVPPYSGGSRSSAR
jgi:hypothetical protein